MRVIVLSGIVDVLAQFLEAQYQASLTLSFQWLIALSIGYGL